MFDAFLNCGDQGFWYDPAYDGIDELKAAASWQGFDSQEDFAELSRPSGLFLVPMVSLGIGSNGFLVSNFRRSCSHFNIVAILQFFQHDSQVELTQTADDRFICSRIVLHQKALIFSPEFVQGV